MAWKEKAPTHERKEVNTSATALFALSPLLCTLTTTAVALQPKQTHPTPSMVCSYGIRWATAVGTVPFSRVGMTKSRTQQAASSVSLFSLVGHYFFPRAAGGHSTPKITRHALRRALRDLRRVDVSEDGVFHMCCAHPASSWAGVGWETDFFWRLKQGAELKEVYVVFVFLFVSV